MQAMQPGKAEAFWAIQAMHLERTEGNEPAMGYTQALKFYWHKW